MIPAHNPPAAVAWRLFLLVLALTSSQSARALKADGSMTMLEMEMAEKGSFSYASLPESSTEQLFEDYLLRYSRTYATVEERNERYVNFKESLAELDVLNASKNMDKDSAVFGITVFADLSPAEFQAQNLGAVPPQKASRRLAKVANVPAYQGTATSVDWTSTLATPVKDQGGCGSCWAFSATAQIESDSIKAGLTTTSTILSVQQITKCTYGSTGCLGGWPQTAYHHVRNGGGITYDYLYPYDIPAPTCNNDKKAFVVTVVDQFAIMTGEQAMIQYVLGGGTLSVVVDATNWGAYRSGIYSSCVGTPNINHAVNIVGVNVPGNYWIVRNSWGEWWGEKGYMKLQLGSNMCGVTTTPTYVTVAAVGPPQKPKNPTATPTLKPNFKPSEKPLPLPSRPASSPTRRPRRAVKAPARA